MQVRFHKRMCPQMHIRMHVHTYVHRDVTCQVLMEKGYRICAWVHTHPAHSHRPSSIDIHQQAMVQATGGIGLIYVYENNSERLDKNQPLLTAFQLTEHGMEKTSRCRLNTFHSGVSSLGSSLRTHCVAACMCVRTYVRMCVRT